MKIRRLFHLLMVPLPSFAKKAIYRTFFGYRIGRGVRIGFSVVDARRCELADGARIGHLNFIAEMGELVMGPQSVIGHLNIVLGGDAVRMGEGAVIGRLNEINSILNPLNHGDATPILSLGRHAIVTAWHKIDYTDAVDIGDSAIIAGRHSCLWTHNRQQVAPVRIGRRCYVGSGVQFVPGAGVGDACVVGLGSAVTKYVDATGSLVAGVPARVIKPLEGDSLALVQFPTRPDLEGKPGMAGEA